MADTQVNPSAESLIGTTVGDYKIIDIIGQGGMGTVYTAEHQQLHHLTACKVLRAEVANHPETVERFLQEARFISRIRHINLIDIFDIGELPDKRLYYVMEKLNGRTLTQAIRGGKLPFAAIVSITNQICAGLSAAHEAGLIHRDLKPDNLFLVERTGEEPLLKIMDFGVAKVMDLSGADGKITRTGYLIGTPQYMSPEQINGVAIDKRSDIYALGVILHEMCTGTAPFRGDTLGQMLIAHLQQVLPTIDPKLRNEDVPAGIEWIIRKALAKDPNERYSSVEELSADMARLAKGEPTQAQAWYKTYQARELQVIQTLSGNTINLPLGQPSTKKRLIWVAATLLPGLLLCGIGGYLWYRHRNAPVVVQQVKAPVKPKREEIDMLALRSYALQVLQDGLKDADLQPRLLSVSAIGASRDTRHHTLLEPKLLDPEPVVQVQAAGALAQIGSKAAIPSLLKLHEEAKDPKVALATAEALMKLGDRSVQKYLEQKAKKDPDAKLQLLAALALEELLPGHTPQKAVQTRLKKGTTPEDSLLIWTRRAKLGDHDAQQQLATLLGETEAPIGRQIQIAALLAKEHIEQGKTYLAGIAGKPGPQQILAAQLLCAADDPSGLPLLRTTFGDAARAPVERLLAADGLGSCGTRKDAGMLAKALKDGEKSPLLRQAEAGAILRLASGDPAVLNEQSLTWAQAALSNDDWTVRESAVAMLGDTDPQKAIPLLGQAMKDQRAEVRKTAAVTLGKTKVKGAIAVLGSAIADANRDVRLDVLRSIGKVSTDLKKRGEQAMDAGTQAELQKALVTRADTGDASEQVMAAATLLRLGDDSRRDKLKQGLAADDPEVKQLAISEVSADPELSKTALTTLLADPSQAVRFKAACELAEQGKPDGKAVLKDALKSGGTDGFRAYGLLKKLGESVEPPKDLAALLSGSDPAVRASVVEAAKSLPVADAVPLLQKAVKDSAPQVRKQVIDVISDWPPADGTAQGLPLLKTLADDSDVAIRSRAALLVAQLTPKAPPEPEEVEAPEPTGSAPSAPSQPAATVDMATPAPVADLSTRVDLASLPDLSQPAPAPAPDMAAPAVAAAAESAPAAPAEEEDKGGKKLKLKQVLSQAEKYLSRGDYQKAIQLLESARSSDSSKEIMLQLGQAYEFWSEQESGAKQKAITKKAIEAYKQVKNAEAKARIQDLQSRLH
jgi:serine/threonine protein kinase/HEAT repeat protein